MKNEDGDTIPFCKEKFNFKVSKGQEDLKEYLTFTVNDRDEEVGQLRLKMQTLINGGKQFKNQGLSKKKFMDELEEERTNWFPMFSDLNQSPGSLQVQTKFIADERWKTKFLSGPELGCCQKCCVCTCLCCIFSAIIGGVAVEQGLV